jgi:hypothetical protein
MNLTCLFITFTVEQMTAWMCLKRCTLVLTTVMFSLGSDVPTEIASLLPAVKSPDFGLFPSCEVPRGSNMVSSGVCVPETEVKLDFCGEFVTYASCIPPVNLLWPNWNATAKDNLVQQMFQSAVDQRKKREQDSLTSVGTIGYVRMLFTGNDACVSEYKRILCLYNFPACDSTVHVSNLSPTYGICAHRCDDFFTRCNFDPSMVSSVCRASKAEWPLSSADSGNITSLSSDLVDETTGEDCTGRGVETVTYSIAFAISFRVIL